jgi:hypothetical protein
MHSTKFSFVGLTLAALSAAQTTTLTLYVPGVDAIDYVGSIIASVSTCPSQII